MATPFRPIPVDSAEYFDALRVFAENSTEMARKKRVLEQVIASLQSRRVFVDFGAGNGDYLDLGASFKRRIAVEPVAEAAARLRERFDGITVIESRAHEAVIDGGYDFGLASHILYYTPDHKWGAHILRMARHMNPGGALAVFMMSPIGGTNRMLKHFGARRIDLVKATLPVLLTEPRFRYEISTVRNSLRFKSNELAILVARWMMMDRDMDAYPDDPTEDDFLRFVHDNFWIEGESCWGWESPAVMLRLSHNPDYIE